MAFTTLNFDNYGLLCEEVSLGEHYGNENQENVVKTSTLLEHDVLWEDDELVKLFSKEKEMFSCFINDNENNNVSLMLEARKEAIEWILKVVGYYGFTALTAVLSVKYYDMFVSSICFQKDKPWISQLAAVACLSIAAKMEEIQVPLLLDLQVEKSKYVFEAKTIMRMELLVLSTLNWRTSIVTPISFIDHIVRRFGLLMTDFHGEFIKRCESILLAIIADCNLMHHLSSVIATATMLFVLKEIDPYDVMNHQNQLLDVLKRNKGDVDECSQIIAEVLGYHHYERRKRKCISIPGSPSGIIDANLSCDSSNGSWSVASSVSSSPEPMFKRSRALDQSMRLTPMSSPSMVFGCRIR